MRQCLRCGYSLDPMQLGQPLGLVLGLLADRLPDAEMVLQRGVGLRQTTEQATQPRLDDCNVFYSILFNQDAG